MNIFLWIPEKLWRLFRFHALSGLVLCAHGRHIVLVDIELVFMAVAINNIIAGNDRNAVDRNFDFFIRIFTLIYAYPKHDAAFSSASYLGLPDPDYGILVILFLDQLLQLGSDLGLDINLEHKLSNALKFEQAAFLICHGDFAPSRPI